MKKLLILSLLCLIGCGKDGVNGTNGKDGVNGANVNVYSTGHYSMRDEVMEYINTHYQTPNTLMITVKNNLLTTSFNVVNGIVTDFHRRSIQIVTINNLIVSYTTFTDSGSAYTSLHLHGEEFVGFTDIRFRLIDTGIVGEDDNEYYYIKCNEDVCFNITEQEYN